MAKLTLIRRTVQLSFAGLFLLVPWLNSQKIYGMSGNFLSFNFYGIPLADPLTAVQTGIATGTIAPTLLVGAAIPLALALLLGAVFCSWICPYGLISELNQSLNKKVREPSHAKRTSGFRGKLFLVGLGLICIIGFGAGPVLNQLSLPGWYSRAIQYWFIQGAIPTGAYLLLIALAVDLLSGSRLWCRYCCPQSLLLMLVGRLSPKRVRIVYDKHKCTCTTQSPCRNACPLSLNPKGKQGALELECNNCGECAVACAKFGKAITQKIAPKP